MAEVVRVPRAWENVKSWQPTDQALASAYLSELENDPEVGFAWVGRQWLSYRKGIWRSDDAEVDLDRSINRFCQKLGGTIGRKISHRKKIEAKGTRDAIKAIIACELSYPADAFDANDEWVAFPSCVYDIKLDCFFPHKKEHLISRCCAVDPDENCPTYTWDAAVDRVIPNKKLQAYCYRFWGYGASGFTTEQAMMFMHGPGGSGKGTLLDVVRMLLGDYAAQASVGCFAKHKFDRHPEELAGWRGKRFIVADETDDGAWNEGLLKHLVSSGEPVTAHFMNQNSSSYIPKFKLAIAGNTLPQVEDTGSGAMHRRMHVVPMFEQLSKQHRIKHIKNDLKEEWPGIMHKLIEGLRDWWRQQDLAPPDVVEEQTEEYMREEDLVGEWLKSCELIAWKDEEQRLVDDTRKAPTCVLWKDSFKQWAFDRGAPTHSVSWLSHKLAAKKFLRANNIEWREGNGRRHRDRGFSGLRMPPPPPQSNPNRKLW